MGSASLVNNVIKDVYGEKNYLFGSQKADKTASNSGYDSFSFSEAYKVKPRTLSEVLAKIYK